jgi:hypothetical protein
MEIHGSISKNLEMALESAKRLRGHVVHADTLQFWTDLLSEARKQRRHAGGELGLILDDLIGSLEIELGDWHGRRTPQP